MTRGKEADVSVVEQSRRARSGPDHPGQGSDVHYTRRVGSRRRTVHAVDDFTSRSARRNVGSGRRIGLRQVDGRSHAARCDPGFTSGSSFYNGKDITNCDGRAWRALRSDMQLVFQDPYSALNPKSACGRSSPNRSSSTAWRRARRCSSGSTSCSTWSACRRTSARKYPHAFSGGQRQRIVIARALALDRRSSWLTRRPLRSMSRFRPRSSSCSASCSASSSLSYLFISHNLAVVRHISDRVAIMYLGSMVEIGDAKNIYDTPRHPYTQALLSAVPIPDPTVTKTGRCWRATSRAR